MKISLALIVAPTEKEAQRLDRALSSVPDVFDEICITQAGPHPSEEVSEVIKKHNGKESFFKWIGDFAAARNYNFEQCTGDWIMWLDADDIVRGAENIRNNVNLANSAKVTGLSLLYHYAHDKQGRVTDSHQKLQIVKNGFYEWKGVIHEDLLPVKDGKNASIKDVVRVHTANAQDSENSLKRNIEILEKAMVTEPNEPRHYFYAARCYLGTEQWDEVIKVITKYLTLSDWKEERYDALNMMGEAYMRMEDQYKAIETHHKAILELEDAPDAYIFKARNYVQKEKWLQALTNLEIAEQRDKEAVVLKRAALYDHDLYILSTICYLNLGMFQQGLAAATRAYNNRKSDQAKELVELAQKMVDDEEMTLLYRKLGKTMIEEPAKLEKLLETVPNDIKDDPRILQLQFTANKPKKWADNSFVWFCGGSVETWDGNSVKNGGIGGSETAVIELSKRMAALGKEVTVYNHCDAPAGGKVIDGVRYVNFWEFNKEDHFNTLCLWRHTSLIDEGIKANKVIVDMHDVSSDGIFTQDRLEKIDLVFVKTEYHKTLYPSVPEEKFVVVGNGIDLTRFDKNVSKSRHRFIYTSCASRGLENILDAWPEIRDLYNDAELHIFYGWKTFYEAHKNDPAKLAWMESMQEKMAQEGIVNHGRVDQTKLAREMLKSNLWLYPTEFPEIHCITALEMQAAKVYPITTGYAALAETQVSGVKIPGDPKSKKWKERFLNEIELAVSTPKIIKKEIEAGRKYAEDCSWDNVVKTWMEII